MRIRRRGGIGNILNSKSEYNRCHIARLRVEDEGEQEEREHFHAGELSLFGLLEISKAFVSNLSPLKAPRPRLLAPRSELAGPPLFPLAPRSPARPFPFEPRTGFIVAVVTPFPSSPSQDLPQVPKSYLMRPGGGPAYL